MEFSVSLMNAFILKIWKFGSGGKQYLVLDMHKWLNVNFSLQLQVYLHCQVIKLKINF